MAEAATQTYKVSLKKVARHAGMNRGGEYFTSGETKELDLSDEQAEVFKNDRLFTIRKSTSTAEKATDEGDDAGESEGTPSTDTGQDGNDGGNPPQAPENTTDEGKEKADGEGSEDEGDDAGNDAPTQPLSVDELLKNNSRDALVAQAKEAKLDLNFDDQQATTKRVIAEALVAAQAPKE